MKNLERRPHGGFTLAEMMVVIVILGLLAIMVVPNVMKRLSTAFGGRVKADITMIEQSLDEFAINNGGRYPDSLEVLVTPDVNGNTYLKGTRLPRDPWNNEYLYEPPSPATQNRPRIYTLGKDLAPGGEGDNEDVDNFSIRGEELR